jgi:hypothetical protein
MQHLKDILLQISKGTSSMTSSHQAIPTYMLIIYHDLAFIVHQRSCPSLQHMMHCKAKQMDHSKPLCKGVVLLFCYPEITDSSVHMSW